MDTNFEVMLWKCGLEIVARKVKIVFRSDNLLALFGLTQCCRLEYNIVGANEEEVYGSYEPILMSEVVDDENNMLSSKRDEN